MIEISNLVKYYGDILAIDRISFSVKKGEILGFLGPNGAGKTTAMNIITGFLSASSGSVKINGYDILEQPELAKRSIGYLPEQPPLYLDMTVREYLRFVCNLKSVPRMNKERHIAAVMSMVKISDVADRMIHNLSKGYRQRVGLAQALISNPDILILDEPTIGLDPKQIMEMRALIKFLSKEHTIVLSSHILPEVHAVCDRIVIINKGRIVASDTPFALAGNMGSGSKLSLTIESPPDEAEKAIRSIPGVVRIVQITANKNIRQFEISSAPKEDVRKAVSTFVAKHAWPIIDFHSIDPTLEDIYLSITSSDERIRR